MLGLWPEASEEAHKRRKLAGGAGNDVGSRDPEHLVAHPKPSVKAKCIKKKFGGRGAR